VLLRLLSYNIHKCIGGLDRRYNPDRICEVIAHYKPDVVVLQEVDRGARRSDGHHQTDVLGDKLGYRHRSWFPNVKIRGGGDYGNAILSRFAITHTSNIDLTIPPKKKRSVLHAKFRVRLPSSDPGNARTLHVYNAHLGLSGIERARQLRRFLESHPFQGLHHRTPIILAGDFNDVWGTLGPKLMFPSGFRGLSPSRTFPAYAPMRALDSIYVRGDVELVHLQPGRIAAARSASDHLPLIADLRITGV
jgi:endonuclease/exonuclease/phosphatase family metal-dependent hydrolase